MSASSDQQDNRENVGLAPLPARPPGATLMPGNTYRNSGAVPLYVINPAVFQDWLNRNYGQRIQYLRQRIQAVPVPRPVFYPASSPVFQDPAYAVDSDLDDYDDGGYDDWDGMSGIAGLSPGEPASVGATQVAPPRKKLGHILPLRPAVGPLAPRHAGAIGPIRPRNPQQEIAQLKQALATCQRGTHHPHPTVAQLNAIKAKHYQDLIGELEHALLAAGITIAEDNHTLIREMMPCPAYDGVSGQEGQKLPPNGRRQADDLGHFHGGHGGRVSGPDGDGDVGRGFGGGGHGGGHGGHGGFGGRGRWGGGWGGGGWGYGPAFVVDDPMYAYDDPYAGYPGMMGVQQPRNAPGAAYPIGSPPAPPPIPGAPSQLAAEAGNLGCANGSCGSPTATAAPSLGTFLLPGFSSGPTDGTSGYGPS